MTAYLWVTLALFAISAIGKAVWLGTGNIPPRLPAEEVGDLIVTVAMVAWGVALLVRHEG